GRIQHDRIEPLAGPLEAAELVEHVADARVDGDAVPLGIQPDARHRVFRHVDRNRLLAAPSEREREPAVVAETVEQPASRVSRRGRAVLALIEEQPRLLSAPKIDVVLDSDLRHRYRLRYVAGEHLDPLFEPFELTCARIVSREDAFRTKELLERRDDDRQESIHPLGQRLHDQMLTVSIDDERRKEIRLAMNEAIGGRVDFERRAKPDSRVEA